MVLAMAASTACTPACRFDPLWNSLVVCGLQPEADSSQKPFIGFVGMIGTHYEDVNVATGDLRPYTLVPLLVQNQTEESRPAHTLQCRRCMLQQRPA